jgi:23S rRNA maturation-related 3'-5' exoribonuclease YhaM
MSSQEKFDKAITYIKREGIENLISWLKTTDFFTAPSSTIFHCNYSGGLLEHSVNVIFLLLLIENLI